MAYGIVLRRLFKTLFFFIYKLIEMYIIVLSQFHKVNNSDKVSSINPLSASVALIQKPVN